jgi:hypothetical protein
MSIITRSSVSTTAMTLSLNASMMSSSANALDTGFSLIYKNPTLWEHTYVAGDPIDYTPPRAKSIAAIAQARGESRGLSAI